MAKGIIGYIRDRQSTIASGLAALLIIIGGFLVFNYLSGLNRTKAPSITPEATQSVRPQENQGQPAQPGTQVALPTTYTVVRGDSLSAIAKKYYGDGNRWTEIAQANNLAKPNLIHAGNILSIPKIEPSPQATAEVPAKGTAPVYSAGSTNVKPGVNYTVRTGDTLWDIATVAYGSGYQWFRIDSANAGIPRSSLGKPLIYPGQVVRIP